ncbi:hypothetical protein GACE_0977 [Geoglobus acetivorans]|uniref:Zinc-ribbon domain-containing protein n=2 Tax=Geoglobus acetivorans TaxID=565033 RepID=A0A0A7GDU6_GEOAI|nr:hypothetical protein GACE_0977 [Geoglobus acetivorans]
MDEEHQFGSFFVERVFQKANEIWKRTSPYPLESDTMTITVEDGIFKSTLPSFVLVAALGEVMFEIFHGMFEDVFKGMASKILEEAKTAAVMEIKKDLSSAIIPPKVCKKCSFPNPPTAKYCSECGTYIEEDEDG